MKKPVLIIGGPTASGKSGLALSVAEQMHGIVINGDSMQVYQGLPILTAQPSGDDKARVPHRLYSVRPPGHACSAAVWRYLALAEISRSHAENKLPIIAGGTGFYLKTLLRGISPIPDIPQEVRARISALQKELGNPAFHHELSKLDPVIAARLPPFNTQRLVRAWEVLEFTGKSLAEWQSMPPDIPPDNIKFLTITLLPPRAALYKACDSRFEQMLAMGAVEEVKQFRAHCQSDAALSKALGYTELCAFLDGKISLTEAIIKAQQATRHYAKRQVTWFRHQIAADLILDNPVSPPLAWIRENSAFDC